MSKLIVRLLIGTMFLISAACVVVAIGAGWLYFKAYDTDTSTAAVVADCQKAVARGDYTAAPRGELTTIDLCVEDTFSSLPMIGVAFVVAITFGVFGLLFLIFSIFMLRRQNRRRAMAA
jgi:hypothetical protein